MQPTQIIELIQGLVKTSPLNRMPTAGREVIFAGPLVRFADGNDLIFTDYKKIIASTHLTPREALASALSKKPEELPAKLSVISWVLPIMEGTRQANRKETRLPARIWSYTRWHGEKFNDALRAHLVEALNKAGYLATAPVLQPYFKISENEKGRYSNWSERHVAYAAGQGTFSLSDGFITEAGIAQRCGSVVTDLVLPPSPRTATGPYANCLFYVDRSCQACIKRCPAGAISEKGHDKNKCYRYMREDNGYLLKEYDVGVAGCGLCQTAVPCESRNPVSANKQR